MKRAVLAAMLLFLLLLAGGAACAKGELSARRKATVGTFGTASTLTLYDDYDVPGNTERFDAVWEEIKQILAQMDALLSTTIETSEIARFNALRSGEAMEISPLTAQVFEAAREMYVRTEGYFNPAVLPLVDLWGFSPRFLAGDDQRMPYDRERIEGACEEPGQAYIEAFVQLTDLDGIVLEGDGETGYRLRKTTPAVEVDGIEYNAQIDLGGIAKGYAVDRVLELLAQRGYRYGYFSCGGSSIGFMERAPAAEGEEKPVFGLEIRSPRKEYSNLSCFARLELSGQALSSSGDYENTYMIGDQMCCHLINPKTGYPLNYMPGSVQKGICTVTLLSGSAMEDDALTTALCLMGPKKALDYVNRNLRDRQVILVLYQTGTPVCEVLTNLPEGELLLLDDACRIVSSTDGEGRIAYHGAFFEELQ